MDPRGPGCFHWGMRNAKPIGLVLSAAIAAASWGCGNNPSTSGKGWSAGTGGNGGPGNGGASNGGSSQGGGGVGGCGGVGGGGSSQGGSGGMACAGSTVKGELIPLDMYIMLDKSGSMADKTG